MIGILFDLDGTLLDTLEDLTDAVNHALVTFGYPERTIEEIRRFVGNGAERLIRLSVPENADWKPVYTEFQTFYKAHCQVKTKPYAGIMGALQALAAKYPVAIVSNKPDISVKPLCAGLFPGIYARGESSACPRKPAPDMVYMAMQAIGVDKCIYVGDSEVDVLTAKNAGVPCLSVTWGFREESEIRAVGGTHFCHTPDMLPEMLDRMAEAYMDR